MMENIDLVGQFWQSMCDAAQNVGAQTEFDRDLAETVHAAAGLVAQVLTSTLGIRLASQKFLSLACLCFAGAPMARGAYRTLQRKRSRQEALRASGNQTGEAPRTSRRLPEDLVLCTLVFLDAASLNALRLTCRDLRDVVSRPSVWAELAVRRLTVDVEPLGRCVEKGGYRSSVPPSSVRQWLHIRRLCQQARGFPAMPDRGLPDGVKRLAYDAYRFVGRVGVANRCVMSAVPLPRPKIPPSELFVFRAAEMAGMVHMLPLRQLRRWGGAPEPFISPVVVKQSQAGCELQITPRLVSYYEVTLLESDEALGRNQRGGAQPRGLRTLPCIAVGLSTTQFRPHAGPVGRMPGWDNNSYGYHSDDGGFFHDRGVMQCALGRGYGPGDTIGCGIDYTPGDHDGARIFFTINGSMISYAKCVAADEDFFPTVGVDSNDAFRLNFGQRPYLYDLQAHCARAMARAVEEGHISVPKRRSQTQCTKQQCWRDYVSSPPTATIRLRSGAATVE